jgi:Ca2+-binding EF-hand superfamily protein
MRIQKVENVGKALKFIEEHNVKLASIGPEAIVDYNRTLTLGMVWTVILRFAISDLSEEGLSAKQGLLLWCQKKTAGYHNVDVKDFQDSFKDGLAFCAIIHRHRPELLEFDPLNKENARDNLNLAFDVAEKHLGIPKLLDTEDIVNMPRPDERSIMTYCAALYKVFSASDKAEVAGRRLAKFIGLMKTAADMMHDYESRAQALRQFIDAKTAEIAGLTLGADYVSIKQQIGAYKQYRRTVKVEKTTEQGDLAVLFSVIQTKLKNINRPPYVPPEGLDTQALETAMENLTAMERKHRTELNAQMRSVLDGLRQAFATPANAFFDQLQQFKAILAQPADGQIADQITFLHTKKDELVNTLGSQLPLIKAAEEACEAANIEENEYSDHVHDDLQANYDQTVKAFDKKIVMLESQVDDVKGGVPPEKIAEFQESFSHFDSNGDGHLDRLEFKSCLASLGVIDVDFGNKDTGSEKLFQQVSQGDANGVTFDMYVKYMISLTEDTIDPSQLASSFKVVSNGKDFITAQDMQRAQMTPDQVEYLKSSCPQSSMSADGYDYSKWLQQ